MPDHNRLYSTSIPPTSTTDSVKSLVAGRCEMRASAMGLLWAIGHLQGLRNFDSSRAEADIAAKMAGHKKVLVVLDFDWSLLEENSDTWVLQQLGATDIFKQLLAEGRPWTQSMDEALLRTHTELGAGQDSVLQTIHSTPFHQDMMQVGKLLT
jgi:hypothetical protein